jgi:two-component system, LytTR family, sensor kinase
MKKLYLLLLSIVLLAGLFLFSIFFAFTSHSVHLSNNDIKIEKETEKNYWEFLKERLFDDKTPRPQTYYGDFLIKMYGASYQDSMIVSDLLKELRQLIPNRKIGFCEDFNLACGNKSNQPIDLRHSDKQGTVITFSRQQLSYGNNLSIDVHSKSGHGSMGQSIGTGFNDTISLSDRKQLIEYYFLRTLCWITGDPKKAKTFFNGSIFNSFDLSHESTRFSNADKFLIKKLYSPDFQKQFKKYLIDNYSWRYYMQFSTPKSTIEMRGFGFSIICGLILFILLYHFFFRRNYKHKYLGYIIPGFLITISFIFVTTIFKFFTTNDDLITNLLSYSIFLIVFAIAISAILYFIEGFLIKPDMSFLLKFTIKITMIAIVLVIPFGIFSIIFGMGNEVFVNMFIISLALATGRGTVLFLNEITESLVREKDVELSKLRELKAQSEIASLHARINPHFLYNSLNSIAGLAHSNPDKTEKMALSLSDLFRYTINRTNEQMSSIKEEVDMVKTYLEIEQIRFGERMSFTIEADKELESQLIPKFILQPLVENAIKHGVSKIEGKGEISLSIRKTAEGIAITVADNGPAFAEGLVSGYGLQSLYDILKLSYGDKAEVNWQNEPQKMISVIIRSNMNQKS